MGSSCPLRCRVDWDSQEESHKIFPFVADATKKNSVFWLKDTKGDTDIRIPFPVVTLTVESTEGPFVLGGFQLESNSKMIEVYLSNKNESTNEYLTTCRAVGNPCKAICVIPGGPRQVFRLHLKLKSLQPSAVGENDTSATVRLKALKLTARIPDVTASALPSADGVAALSPDQIRFEAPSLSPFFAHSKYQHSQAQPAPSPIAPPTLPSLSQGDLSSAMAALSMMMRSTENRIVESVSTRIHQQQALQQQELQKMTQLLLEQRICIQQQSNLLTMQSRMIQQQGKQIADLLEGQEAIRQALLKGSVLSTKTSSIGEDVIDGGGDINAEGNVTDVGCYALSSDCTDAGKEDQCNRTALKDSLGASSVADSKEDKEKSSVNEADNDEPIPIRPGSPMDGRIELVLDGVSTPADEQEVAD